MSSSETIFSLSNLKKSYGSFLALDIDQLSIYKGDKILITGANGAGKSTLLRILAGIISLDSGDLKANNYKVSLFEENFLQIDDLTVRENCKFISLLVKDRLIADPLELFDLQKVIDKQVKVLSKGWRMRLGLAVTFSVSNDLLLLDEPLDGLDREGKEIFLAAYSDHHKDPNKSSCIATHQIEPFLKFNAKNIEMKNGQLVQ